MITTITAINDIIIAVVVVYVTVNDSGGIDGPFVGVLEGFIVVTVGDIVANIDGSRVTNLIFGACDVIVLAMQILWSCKTMKVVSVFYYMEKFFRF